MLGDTIADVHGRRKTLVLFNYEGSDRLYERIRRFFRFRNADVERGVTDPESPRNYAVLYDDTGVFATSSVDDLDSYLPTAVSYRDAMAVSGASNRPSVFSELDSTVYTITGENVDLLHRLVSDIELLAESTGDGRLSTSVCRFDGLRDDEADGVRDRYRRFGRRGVDVHVYGRPTVEIADLPVTCHPVENAELAETWVATYDGGGRPTRRAAVVAKKHPDGYEGFWTFESNLVETVIDYLSTAYPDAERP